MAGTEADDGGAAPVAALDEASPADAGDLLAPVCASRRWVAAVVAGRPYSRLGSLTAAALRVLDELDWADVDEALSAHPRIGQRPAASASLPSTEPPRGVPGTAAGGAPLAPSTAEREAAWSAQEQAAAAADASLQVRLREVNTAYEDRFGRVFLIRATGRSAAEVVAAARERLGNDETTEQQVVRRELREIVELRLGKAFGPDPSVGATVSVSTHVLDATTGSPAAGMSVRLARREPGGWAELSAGVTDADGRIARLGSDAEPGDFRLTFDVADWTTAPSFYPEVVLSVRSDPGGGHLHVPLLLSPFAYSTYRGS